MVRKKKEVIEKTLQEKIKDHRFDMPTMIYDSSHKINTHSWFNIHENEAMISTQPIASNLPHANIDIIKCKQINVHFTSDQIKIAQSWFYAYTKMYNETVHYIRKNYELTRHNIDRNLVDWSQFTFFTLRSKLYDIKTNLTTKYDIYTHILDNAIKQVANNISSAKTNILRGNIKHFKLRYWKYDRNSQTMTIEKCYITKNKLCPQKFGDIKYTCEGNDYILNNIDCDVKLNYNKLTNRYILNIPYEEKSKIRTTQLENKKTNRTIALDPGLRTFMTGISETKTVNIADNVNKTIVKYVKRINKIKNNDNISDKIKKKNEIMINRKIHNKVDDLQWKTIKYLTKNYDTIYLGDMSSQKIVRKENNILSPEQKVSCLRTRYYTFQQRLAFKCKENGNNYKLVDEKYTSKTCSICGEIKNDLGGNKLYKCENKMCLLEIDRDVNGARNIYINSN